MKTIWKYNIPPADEFTQEIPKGAQFLAVQVQRAAVMMWWLVDSSEKREERHFAVVGTGHPAPDNGLYLGTFQVHGGDLVFHLFDLTPLGG